MKKTLLLTVLVLFSFSYLAQAQKKDKKDIAGDAQKAIAEMKKQDPGISKFFNSAYGYAVFPNVGKGGLGVGGASGRGIVYRGGKAVADAKLTQVTIGLQAGGQKYSEVIFFENAKSFNDFMSGTYEFAAQVSAIALKSGASANAKYKDGILVVTMGKGGLMYEASVGGQKFKVEKY
jgi:lipid-binding SYLF domain-containing protein